MSTFLIINADMAATDNRARLLTICVQLYSLSRAKEADGLREELLKAKLAEKSAKGRLLEITQTMPHAEYTTVSVNILSYHKVE